MGGVCFLRFARFRNNGYLCTPEGAGVVAECKASFKEIGDVLSDRWLGQLKEGD